MLDKNYDVVVIGGGQAGLVCGYYLAKTKLKYVILDKNQTQGGSWLNTWDSLKLFSPANHSSLSGMFMPKSLEEYPSKKEVIDYLKIYEERFKLNLLREINVTNIEFVDEEYLINYQNYNQNNNLEQIIKSKFIINATGTFDQAFIPSYNNISQFAGKILHSSHYTNAMEFMGSKVLIVGGGNSAAQILAEVSMVAETKWATLTPPNFLPDNVDGRDLFYFATAAYQKGTKQEDKSEDFCGVSSLGDIVMVASVKEARSRNVIHRNGNIIDFYKDGVVWENGINNDGIKIKEAEIKEEFDAVIFCTGFGSNLEHLENLSNLLDNKNRVILKERDFITQPIFESKTYENMYFIGYGNWTGYASATLIGVGRFAKMAIEEINNKSKEI